MAGLKEALKKQLADLLTSLNEQGLLDSHYVSAQSVKEIDGSFAFLELISTFRADCQATIRTLTIELEQPLLDFADMKIQIMKIKGSTSCIGARRLALACGDLRKGICNESKEECILALNRIKEEFQVLQEKLDLVTQLERRILCVNFD